MTDIYQDIEATIPRLRRYAQVLVRDQAAADDLVQDCLVRALEKLHLWQNGTNLRAWLFTILHNQHVNRIRREVRSGVMIELTKAEQLLVAPARQEKRLELRDLDRALRQLPEGQRAVVLLIGLEGMSYHEVAAVLAIPVGTVRSRISRGRAALRSLMDTGRLPPAEQDAIAIRAPRHRAGYVPTVETHLLTASLPA